MRSYHNRAIDLREDDSFSVEHVMQDRILVRPIKHESIIERIDSPNNKPTKGEVVAVGPGKINEKGVRIPMSVEEGDIILFGGHATTEIWLRGEKLLITREENVFGVVE